MICLKREILDKLSSRGVLAYVAVCMAGSAEATTAVLAGLVRAQTGVMLEGLKELAIEAPGAIQKGKKGKWVCGETTVEVQNLDSERYRAFVDDIHKYWKYLNNTLPFSMGAKDGIAIKRFLSDHREWTQEIWRKALNNRVKSEGVVRSQPVFAWVGKLGDYAAGPLNAYGRSQEGSGKHGEAITIRQRNREAVERAIAQA